jgi:hypothetical protein
MLLCAQVRLGADVIELTVAPVLPVTDKYRTSFTFEVVRASVITAAALAPLTEPSRANVLGLATA